MLSAESFELAVGLEISAFTGDLDVFADVGAPVFVGGVGEPEELLVADGEEAIGRARGGGVVMGGKAVGEVFQGFFTGEEEFAFSCVGVGVGVDNEVRELGVGSELVDAGAVGGGDMVLCEEREHLGAGGSLGGEARERESFPLKPEVVGFFEVGDELYGGVGCLSLWALLILLRGERGSWGDWGELPCGREWRRRQRRRGSRSCR